jgi:hypothetical protein
MKIETLTLPLLLSLNLQTSESITVLASHPPARP